MSYYSTHIDINNFKYKGVVTFGNNYSSYKDYVIGKLVLNSNNFNFSSANSNGYDFRLVDNRYGVGVLNMWIAYWSRSTKYAVIFFKIPNVYPTDDLTFDAYWCVEAQNVLTNHSAPESMGFIFYEGFDNQYLDPTKWSGEIAEGDSVYGYLLDDWESLGITTNNDVLTGHSSWIMEAGIYTDFSFEELNNYIDSYCALGINFIGTENGFRIRFYMNDRIEHTITNSSSAYIYGTHLSLEGDSYQEIYISYSEPDDSVTIKLKNRNSFDDISKSIRRKVEGDTRIDSLNIRSHYTNAGHEGGKDTYISWLTIRKGDSDSISSVDSTDLYVDHGHVSPQSIDFNDYGDNIVDPSFGHESNYGGNPYMVSNSIYDDDTNIWITDDGLIGSYSNSSSSGNLSGYYEYFFDYNVYFESGEYEVQFEAYNNTSTSDMALQLDGQELISVYALNTNEDDWSEQVGNLSITTPGLYNVKCAQFRGRYVDDRTPRAYSWGIRNIVIGDPTKTGHAELEINTIYTEDLSDNTLNHYDSGHVTYYNASKLSDDGLDPIGRDSWFCTTSSGWACIRFNQLQRVSVFKIKSTSSESSRPKDFCFYGSNYFPSDDNRYGQNLLVSGTFDNIEDWQLIVFNNNSGYKYYILDVLNTYGGGNININEWELYDGVPFKVRRCVRQLRLHPAIFSNYEYNFPRKICLQGSNDTFNWTTLLPWTDTYTPFISYNDSYGYWQRYSFFNDRNFWIFKLKCRGNWGAINNRIIIGCLSLHELVSENYTERIIGGNSNNISQVWATSGCGLDDEYNFIFCTNNNINKIKNNDLINSTELDPLYNDIITS